MNGLDRLGQWIADHPIVIMAAALLLTIVSLHYAQQIEMQGMTTESMVGKDSPLYQLFDHLYAEKFATESIAVVIESDDITKPEILRAMDLLSQKMREAPNVLAVTSIADIVLKTEERDFGLAAIPDQEDRVDQILSSPSNQPAVSAMMPDKKHTLLSIDLPVTLTEAQLREIYAETSAQVRMAEFPPHVVVTVTGEPALMQSITDEMAKYMAGEFASMKQKGQINRLENIAVRKVEIAEAWQESGKEYISVLFTANLLDYTVDEKSGEVVTGDRRNPVKFEEFWTFCRPIGERNWALSAIQQTR